uniref:Craniofacial development protein 1 n=1 Tax=Ditylenchus dipsaci TaxID=166011 RepID=A0A915ESH4_9BILA
MNSKPAKKKSGLGDVVAALAANKQKKTSVLDQTANDWKEFVQTEKIQEELEQHNQSKDAFLDKQEFLLKADYALFEKEKAVREVNGSTKPRSRSFSLLSLVSHPIAVDFV